MKPNCPKCGSYTQLIHLNMGRRVVKCGVCGFAFRLTEGLASEGVHVVNNNGPNQPDAYRPGEITADTPGHLLRGGGLAVKLNCIKCAAEIPAENINLDRMVAKCAVCNSVFSFEDELAGGRVMAAVKKLDAPQPANVHLENWGGRLTIQWRWFTWKILLATVFALFWNGMMFSFLDGIVTDIPERGLEAAFPSICLPHIWVGFYLIYYVLAGYINQTQVIVDGQTIRVQHGPLPWIGNKTLDSSNVVQLYTKQHRGRNNWGGTYQLHAIAGSDKHEKLLSGLEDSEHALFVEQEVERFLGIEDRPVRGEYGRV